MRARTSPMVGANKKGDWFEGFGLARSFTNNLIASANGWGSPINPTLLGPLRRWKYPRNFRSISV